MPIRFECSTCGKKLKVPDDAAGKRVKCPQCQAATKVPLADQPPEQVFEAEEVEAPEEEAAGHGVNSSRREETDDDDRRPCPMCGEMIKTTAVKCRFCDEIFDKTLKKRAKKKRSRSSDEDEDMTTGDYFVAILCSGIGCIAGVIWLIQGKPKAGKMIGISLASSMVWGVIRVIAETALKNP